MGEGSDHAGLPLPLFDTRLESSSLNPEGFSPWHTAMPWQISFSSFGIQIHVNALPFLRIHSVLYVL